MAKPFCRGFVMLSKSEMWNAIWIPLNKRLPPETDKQVLIWNYLWQQAIPMEAKIARYGGIAMLAGKRVSPDRVYSYWCFVRPPKRKF